MKFLSFNYRGLASHPKKLALKQLFRDNILDVIFLQETLGVGINITTVLNGMLSNWKICTIDGRGRSGCLALGIILISLKIINTSRCDGILVADVFSEELGMEIRLVNVYRPCGDTMALWNNLTNKSFMQYANLVLGRDMNSSLGMSEIWGTHTQHDHLSDFFLTRLNIITLSILIFLIFFPPGGTDRHGIKHLLVG